MLLVVVMALIGRLGYLQVYKSEELRKGALEQWTKAIDIKSKRGIIYDRKGKKLAISISASTIWAYPAEIKDPHSTAKTIAQVLDMDEEILYEKLTKKQSSERIKQWVSREEANELRQLNIRGISVVDDNKRYYPYGNFATSILGFTNIDNVGLDGLEKAYESYLTGIAGKWVRTTDAANRQMPYDGEKIYDAKDGLSIVSTIDETIQHFAEKAAEEGRIQHKAKSVSVIMMDPNTGDILAMTTKGDYDYDLNNPRIPIDENVKKIWGDLPQDELQEKWYEMWRNNAISDIYEPGSTFKVITAAAAIEENTTTPDSHYFCAGTVKVQGRTLKCSRWYNPHGSLTFKEGFDVSCNIVFVNAGSNLGKEKFYKYVKGFGFGEKSGIELSGEQKGIIPYNLEGIKEINLSTMSYGHGIAVTPLQMVNALSSVVNGGNLMRPRLVSQLIDNEGNIIESFQPEITRKVISEATSKTMLDLLESVVTVGSGSRAQVPGYRVGGKTGTAQKVIDGRYAQNKYIGSFVAVAPIDNPQIAMIVIVDEPGTGVYYGGSVAAPIAKVILEDTFNYLEIPPVFTEKDKENITEKVIVPDVRNTKIGIAGKTLTDLGLKYTTEYSDITSESIVIDQFPKPGLEVIKGSIVDIYLNIKQAGNINMPYLVDKTREEVINILDDMNIQYTLTGTGTVIKQEPNPGEEINSDTNISIEFSETNIE
jgi:stage V sporulation protein D (sporulation-specific penicillin-binding protein)